MTKLIALREAVIESFEPWLLMTDPGSYLEACNASYHIFKIIFVLITAI